MSRITLLFAALTFAASAFAEIEDWIPKAQHADLVSQGRDCAIYRSLATKARLTLEQTQDAELHFSELLKVRRADLVQCADLRGIEMDGSLDSEEAAAETCSELYHQWVRTGYRLRAVLEDREGTQHSMDLLNSNLERYCARPSEVAPALIRFR